MSGSSSATMVPTVCVSWSGGIDSTSCLWQLLRDGVCVLAHHVELRTPEGRWQAEREAVDAQREWFRAHGYGDQIVWKETGFAYGNVAKFTRDINITAFMAGFILSGYPSVTAAVISSSADDVRRQRDPVIQSRRKQLTEIMAGRSFEWLVPNEHKTKAEVMAEMPPDLLALCWYCRRPRRENGRWQRCGVCRTCREVIAAESMLGA